MNRLGLASVSLLGSMAFATVLSAQTGAPPPPPPPPLNPTPSPTPPGAAPPTAPGAPAGTPPNGVAPGAAPPTAPTAPTPPTPPTPPPRAGGAASASASGEARLGLDDGWQPLASEATDEPENDDLARQWRKASLKEQNSLNGSTGQLHLSQAGSGATGTFRFSLLTSVFSGSGVLCNADSPCPSIDGRDAEAEDQLDQVSAHLGLSATLLPFLEAYAGFHNKATSNSRGRPQLLQVLGDTNLGVKGFMPAEPDRLYSFGGEAELWLLNGTGGVGLDGSGTSFVIRGLGTLDLNNRLNADDRVPIRAHLNLGYRVDRSGNLVFDLENTDPPNGRGTAISRIERFGLGINRVDFFEFGLGAEYVHPIVRPFMEWTLDAPLNRQDYTCNIDDAIDRGESCLRLEQGIGIAPSRLTFGARLFPWEDRGLALLAAFDIGTSATSTFIDEVAPELPWNLWISLAYAVDTEPPKPVIQRVEAPPPPPVVAPPVEQYIQGTVRERGTETPIPNALVRYDGRPLTGMIADEAGTFRSSPLPPGTYTFRVSANGYRDGQCAATIGQPPSRGARPLASPGTAPGAPKLPPQPVTPGSIPGARDGRVSIPVQCELEPLPRVGTIVGSLLDGATNTPVPGARVQATARGKGSVSLQGDATGAFRFNNVPPGVVELMIDAPGYLTSVSEITVKPREEVQARIVLNKRPAQPNVVVQGREVKLRRQVHFETDSAVILPDSMALLEEIADVLKSRAEIKEIEVQGHTDNTGTPLHNQRLSQNRAQAVVDALIRLGVDASRLSAKGYGQDQPLVPNTTEPNRARNRRVQLMITN